MMDNLSINNTELFKWYLKKLEEQGSDAILDLINMLKNDPTKLEETIELKMKYIAETAAMEMDKGIIITEGVTSKLLIQYLKEKLIDLK